MRFGRAGRPGTAAGSRQERRRRRGHIAALVSGADYNSAADAAAPTARPLPAGGRYIDRISLFAFGQVELTGRPPFARCRSKPAPAARLAVDFTIFQRSGDAIFLAQALMICPAGRDYIA